MLTWVTLVLLFFRRRFVKHFLSHLFPRKLLTPYYVPSELNWTQHGGFLHVSIWLTWPYRRRLSKRYFYPYILCTCIMSSLIPNFSHTITPGSMIIRNKIKSVQLESVCTLIWFNLVLLFLKIIFQILTYSNIKLWLWSPILVPS